jgi:NAD(P)H-hydrate epimerase
MKLLSAEQIRALDQFSIQHEGIRSIDLMERAAKACTKRILSLVAADDNITIFCGSGNNGGDGLAIARMLLKEGRLVRVILPSYGKELSEYATYNLKQLKQLYPGVLTVITTMAELSTLHLEHHACAIDALLGTGLNAPVDGLLGELITFINANYKKIISIDIPSGLYADKSSYLNKHIIHCHLCLSFQSPKLAFLLPQNGMYVPEFELLDIGLDAHHHASFDSSYYYVTASEIASLLKPRSKYAHKGLFGHALLVAGSKGKSGAALIAAKACMRSGPGYLTVHSVQETLSALLVYLPEAMSDVDADATKISELQLHDRYTALCFGPGTGTEPETELVLKKILNYFQGPILIDADGLNSLSENKTWLSFLPANTILSPHPKEFERLTEKCQDDFDRLKIIQQFSVRNNCILLYKGAHSIIAMPDGNLFFNSSGNAGLSKAGSGDGLSGIILGLLARGYSEAQATLIGTFVHGYAADVCVEDMSRESVLISDVTSALPRAFLDLEKRAGF